MILATCQRWIKDKKYGYVVSENEKRPYFVQAASIKGGYWLYEGEEVAILESEYTCAKWSTATQVEIPALSDFLSATTELKKLLALYLLFDWHNGNLEKLVATYRLFNKSWYAICLPRRKQRWLLKIRKEILERLNDAGALWDIHNWRQKHDNKWLELKAIRKFEEALEYPHLQASLYITRTKALLELCHDRIKVRKLIEALLAHLEEALKGKVRKKIEQKIRRLIARLNSVLDCLETDADLLTVFDRPSRR